MHILSELDTAYRITIHYAKLVGASREHDG